ncbi:MAG: hypothetical protein ACYDAN_16570 [Candidatus Limnocylindrales bacterium]
MSVHRDPRAAPAAESVEEDGTVGGTDRRAREASPAAACDVRSRALSVWPGLDRKKLTRTCGDPQRVATLVERRTALPREAILRILGVDAAKAE